LAQGDVEITADTRVLRQAKKTKIKLIKEVQGLFHSSIANSGSKK